MLVFAVGLHIPIWISLIFVAVVLTSSVIASLIWPKEDDLDIEVDLPEDFDGPFEELDSNLDSIPPQDVDEEESESVRR